MAAATHRGDRGRASPASGGREGGQTAAAAAASQYGGWGGGGTDRGLLQPAGGG